MANPRYADDLSRLGRVYKRNAVINRETIIIVIGNGIPSELLERPVAEALRDEIDRRGGAEHPFRRAIVLTDSGWNEEATDVALNAVIAIGSHRANELSKKLQEEPASDATKFPIADRQGCNALFQKNSIGLSQVVLWGEHAVDTRSAVELYTEHVRGLDEFLRFAWDTPALAIDCTQAPRKIGHAPNYVYMKFRVQNIQDGTIARNCRAYLLSVREVRGTEVMAENLILDSVQLPWEGGKFEPKDIPFGHSQYGDIVHFPKREGETGWMFHTEPNYIGHKDFQGMIYQFEVRVSGDGVPAATARINIDYGGDWKTAKPYDA